MLHRAPATESPRPYAADVAELVAPAPARLGRMPLISDGEIVILELKPSPWYIVLSCLGSLFAIAFLSLLLAYLSHAYPWLGGWSEADAFGFGLGLATVRLGWQTLDWYGKSYILTDRRVIAVSGVLRRGYFQAPLRNLQHIAVVVSIRERIVRLGTIAFATAGSDAYEAAWLMLPRPFVVHRRILETIERYHRHPD